ncbi:MULTISPECIES: phytanoyl-CoA dioxygenase family protein [unclassified Bradyrhizobium]|uniref:phytanoyl-CoA dioxygenase family protein n=1 Tax=unclassified Bradyrhizobium TaxID=2631580 RepID=UPI0028EEB896|nr:MULTISPECIES: phytanoyl-CoA dioxygenase family protein [unclassified Bradyrhizobium]
MTNIFVDAIMPDDERRQKLYEGALFLYSPTPSLDALVAFARELIEEAFHPYDPRTAQFELPVERYVEILVRLKPFFIHHARSKELVQGALRELGCDPELTYFDVPRLRSATSDDYLTTGIAFAFHPHRDTWYSAPPCQLNWWLPVYDIAPDNGLAFHPRYFDEAIKNGSRNYNYYEWNRTSRASAARHIKTDTRVQPKPEQEIALDPHIRVIAPSGGVTIFSGAHLHSSVPNTSGVTRFSIDFRTVHFADVSGRRGAINVDSESTGTSLRDFLRVTDLARLPEEVVAPYDQVEAPAEYLVYQPTIVPLPAGDLPAHAAQASA